MAPSPVCCIFGQPLGQEESLAVKRALEDHIVGYLGAELWDRWSVEVTYKLKQRKKKPMGGEMKFGVNIAAPFVGMKREQPDEVYPYAKQYCVRRSEFDNLLLVVQEMADGSNATSQGSGEQKDCKLDHVLQGGNELEVTLASKTSLVTRLKTMITGEAYRLGDYVIRIGTCKKGAVYRGAVLEMEYLPSCRVADGMSMIEAFMPYVDEGGSFSPSADLHDQRIFGSNPMYTVKHTAVQTTELLNRVFQ